MRRRERGLDALEQIASQTQNDFHDLIDLTVSAEDRRSGEPKKNGQRAVYLDHSEVVDTPDYGAHFLARRGRDTVKHRKRLLGQARFRRGVERNSHKRRVGDEGGQRQQGNMG
jgi:hypothetical protein